jgi:hypothetical protein
MSLLIINDGRRKHEQPQILINPRTNILITKFMIKHANLEINARILMNCFLLFKRSYT